MNKGGIIFIALIAWGSIFAGAPCAVAMDQGVSSQAANDRYEIEQKWAKGEQCWKDIRSDFKAENPNSPALWFVSEEPLMPADYSNLTKAGAQEINDLSYLAMMQKECYAPALEATGSTNYNLNIAIIQNTASLINDELGKYMNGEITRGEYYTQFSKLQNDMKSRVNQKIADLHQSQGTELPKEQPYPAVTDTKTATATVIPATMTTEIPPAAELPAPAAAPAAPVTAPADAPKTKEEITAEQSAAKSKASDAADAQEYVNILGPGNKIRIKVFGEEDLSGDFEIDGTGILSLPLVGNIQAAGLDPRGLEMAVIEKLKNGYLINPLVSLEVLNYKPVFILGEVNRPGSYPYVNGLTVINAVALGGGFTYRAKTSHFTIFRSKNGKKIELEGIESTLIYPGDTIRVEERLF